MLLDRLQHELWKIEYELQNLPLRRESRYLRHN